MSTTPDNLNYHPVHQLNGKYRFRRLAMNNLTGSSVDLQPAGTLLLQWKFTAGSHFNPSRDVLEFQTVIPAQGAGKAVWTYEDTVPEIDSIRFGTASGVDMVNIQYANNYLSVVRKIDTPLEEFQSSDYGSGLYPAEKLSNAASTGENYIPSRGLTTTEYSPYGVHTSSKVALSKRDPQYARASVIDEGLTVTRSIPFSAFKGTALAMDRDMKFKEDMYLSIYLAPQTKVGWMSNAVNDPVASAAALTVGPVKVQNISLRHAEQIDPVIKAAIDDKFNRGEMIFNIPYVQGFRTPSAGNVANIQLSLPSQLGSKLKRVIHTAFSNDENNGKNHAFDHENFGGSKIENYRTYIDTTPLQDEFLSCLQPTATAHNMDDWRENRHYLSKSSIQDSSTYYLNWFHIDQWSDPKKDLIPEENIVEGLDMIQPRTWGIEANTGGALTHYTWATFIRTVKTSPAVDLEIYAAPTVVLVEQTRQ